MVKEAVPFTEGWKLTFDKDYIHVEIQCRSLTLDISILSHNFSNQCLVHTVLLYNLVYMVFLLLHNLYLEDLIEKNVYTYQVSDVLGSLVIMFNLFYYQIKIYRCSNIFCDTYKIRWSSFARSTHPSLVAEEPY